MSSDSNDGADRDDGPAKTGWQQFCVECEADDLRTTLNGLTLVCNKCDARFPAVVGGNKHPPASSVKLHGPPGTGKTTQLVRRVEELLKAGYRLSDITIVTYRKEMARDILRKLHDRGVIDDQAIRKPWKSEARFIGTLHAICNRLVDIDRPDGLYSEKEAFVQSKYGVRFARGDDETDPTPGELMFSARSWVLENQVDVAKWDTAPQYDALGDAWPHHPTLEDFDRAWSAWKRDEGISDFSDMLVTVLERGIAPATRVVAADEYHDFTPLQARIVEQWRSHERTEVEIVDGDPRQVVYSYAGADAKFYESVDLPEVLLPRSFRVPRRIWAYACRTLEPEHEPPSITPRDELGEVLEVDSVALDELTTRSDSASAPSDLVDQYGEECMFLTRTRSQARDVARELRRAGVITFTQEGAGGWNHAPKRLAIYNCLQSLAGVAPPGGPVYRGQQGLGGFASDPDQDQDQEGDRTPAKSVSVDADELAAFLDRVPAEYLEGDQTKGDAIASLTSGSARVAADELASIVAPEFWRVFTQGADATGELLQYDGRVAIARALRRYDEPVAENELQQRVNVLTIHASKGQESPTVVLYDGVTGRISASMNRDDDERRNEARLWYVGCTRAAERLIVARRGWSYTYSYLPDVSDLDVEQDPEGSI